ncbi:MAG: aspartate aminotransferase family protein [Acidimicrobiales bacterium]|nr:aspartate aminotransferase family protein [Acidimicrobiales bacterium]
MSDVDALFARAAQVAAAYRSRVGELPVAGPATPDELRAAFSLPLPTATLPAEQVLDELVAAAEPGLVHTAGGRFFGFVIGGSYELAVAADMVTAGWDQCAYNGVLTPSGAMAEEVAGGWLKELLGLPPTASVGFVTGGQEANTVGLASGRHHVLAEAGWDVEADGLAGAPRVRIVAGAERHATIDRALRLLGFGTNTLEPVDVDVNGAIRPDALADTLAAQPPGPTIVCLQAGNVNTGACDPLREAIGVARDHGAWVHVDGAFGLWAAASPTTRHLVDGIEGADSWGCDGHKWLNLTYDSGFAICSRPEVHAAAVRYSAAYLTGSGGADLGMSDFTMESSRRAKGFATWALLRHLGRDGVAHVVDHLCAMARRFAAGLADGGLRIANDVVLNIVLADAGDDATNRAIAAAVQAEGTCWLATTEWQGRTLLRMSLSSRATTEIDIDQSVASVLRQARSRA